VIPVVTSFVDDFKNVIFAVVSMLIGISVVQTWARTRSLAPTIGVVLLGAVCLWALASVEFIRAEVAEDVARNNNGDGGNNGRPPPCNGLPICNPGPGGGANPPTPPPCNGLPICQDSRPPGAVIVVVGHGT
jgi:hypothetical protein